MRFLFGIVVLSIIGICAVMKAGMIFRISLPMTLRIGNCGLTF